MFEASHLQHNITSGHIQIVSDGHHLPAYWAHPEIGGPFPGLVMLHDRWGMTAHIRAQARRFAEQGFYVIAPHLFQAEAGQAAAGVPDNAQELREQSDEMQQSYVVAALHALRTHHKCDGKIGLIGWGIGGELALHAATLRDDLRAAVVFYTLRGSITPAEIRMMSTPLLAIFGADDPDTPAEQVKAFRELLDTSTAAHEVQVYAGAGRDFFNDAQESVFKPQMAEQAWKRALDFLNMHLEVPPPDAPEQPGELKPGPVY